jgi:hypothetical protein
MAIESALGSRPAKRQGWLVVNFQEVVHSARTGNADVAKPQRFAEDRMDTHKNDLLPKGIIYLTYRNTPHSKSSAYPRQGGVSGNSGFRIGWKFTRCELGFG